LNLFFDKLREVFISILPIFTIVLLLNFTFVPIDTLLIWHFLTGSFFVLFGLTFFLIGVDLGITPLGSILSFMIAKKNKLWIVIVSAFILGIVISIAEPSLMILGNQVDRVTGGAIPSMLLILVVSLGIGLFMIFGFLRLVYNLPLQYILLGSYVVIFLLGLTTSSEFLAIAFDSSGSTTGVLAVPFILSLSLGIASIKKDSRASEKDSFGLVAIVSAGAIISVMILNLFVDIQGFTDVFIDQSVSSASTFTIFLNMLPSSVRESLMAFLPLIAILILISKSSELSKEERRRIYFGFIYSLIGLSLFLLGVNAGFMQIGGVIGGYLVTLEHRFIFVLISFILGVVTILAEPAVYVLTHQIEEVTTGYVKKVTVLVALSIGVGLAVSLSALRVFVSEIQLWHYLLPGYSLALLLTFVTPKLFVGIAFDAGGVATGPMTATFVLAFINGAANNEPSASILVDGFGMIAMVALMPIITLQLLGVLFKIKTIKKGVQVDE